MIVANPMLLNSGVVSLLFFVLFSAATFLCYLAYKGFTLREHTALIAGVLSFVGTVAFFFVLSETLPQVCCLFPLFFLISLFLEVLFFV